MISLSRSSSQVAHKGADDLFPFTRSHIRAFLSRTIRFFRSTVNIRLNNDDEISAMNASQLRDIGVTRSVPPKPFVPPF